MPYHKIKPKKVHRTTTQKFKYAMDKKIKVLEKRIKILEKREKRKRK